MTKVKCACNECKYINRLGNCSLKQINLSELMVNTVNMGRKQFNECKQFEESDWYKDMKEKVKDLMGDYDESRY